MHSSCPSRMFGLLALKQSSHEQRPHHCGIAQYFGKTPSLFWRHEFSPRNAFLISTAAQAAPIIRFRANSHAVLETWGFDAQTQPHIADLDIGSNLLGPIARNSTADRNDTEPLRRRNVLGVTVQILIGVKRRIRFV